MGVVFGLGFDTATEVALLATTALLASRHIPWCFFIAGIEVLGLFPHEINRLSQSHGFWSFIGNFNINTAGFVIVGMFILTWLAALLIRRYGQIEERWTAAG
jgi:nickel/cobalt transporter (NiCoT) family protein